MMVIALGRMNEGCPGLPGAGSLALVQGERILVGHDTDASTEAGGGIALHVQWGQHHLDGRICGADSTDDIGAGSDMHDRHLLALVPGLDAGLLAGSGVRQTRLAEHQDNPGIDQIAVLGLGFRPAVCVGPVEPDLILVGVDRVLQPGWWPGHYLVPADVRHRREGGGGRRWGC